MAIDVKIDTKTELLCSTTHRDEMAYIEYWDNTTCRRTKDRKIPERVSVFITSSDESAQRATSDENWYEFRDFLVLKWCRHVVLPILLLQNSVKMASQIHCERTENIAQRTLYCNMLDCKILYRSFSLKRAICHSTEPPKIVKLL